MFNWFKPTCPVDEQAKAWVEKRLGWLANQFGLDVFTRRALILPTEDFFPDRFGADQQAAQTLLERVCRYMDADPDCVELKLFRDSNPLWLVNEQGQYLPGAAGLYEESDSSRVVIQLGKSQLSEPIWAIGTIAHELAHLRLLGEKRIHQSVFDNELLTDLTVVFHGLGIFLANDPRAWESQMTRWPNSKLKKPEYMTQPMFGYALAHSAWHRDERKPQWAKFLRPDARCSLKQGIRFLFETEQSEFKPRRLNG